MLQVLSEVVRTEKLLRLVAFTKFVRMVQMLCPGIPIRRIGEFVATEAAQVSRSWRSRVRVERSLNASKRSAGPGMPS